METSASAITHVPPPVHMLAHAVSSATPFVHLRLVKYPAERSFGMMLEQRFVVALDEYAAVVSFIFPQSPAARVGVQRGWMLQHINGRGVRGLSVKDAAAMFRDCNEVDIEFDTQTFSVQIAPNGFSAASAAASSAVAAAFTAAPLNGFAGSRHAFRQPAAPALRPVAAAPPSNAQAVTDLTIESASSQQIIHPTPRFAATTVAAAASAVVSVAQALRLQDGRAPLLVVDGAVSSASLPLSAAVTTATDSLDALATTPTLFTAAAPEALAQNDVQTTEPIAPSDAIASVAPDVVTPVTPAAAVTLVVPNTPVASAATVAPAVVQTGPTPSSTNPALSAAITSVPNAPTTTITTNYPQTLQTPSQPAAPCTPPPVANRSPSSSAASGASKKRARPINASPQSSSSDSASPSQRPRARSCAPTALHTEALTTLPPSHASAAHRGGTAVKPTTTTAASLATASTSSTDAEASPEQPNRRCSRRQNGGGRSTGRTRTSLTLERLVRMGFTRADAAASITAKGDNVDACMVWIVSHLEEKQYLHDLNQASIESELSKREEEKEHKELENETLKRAKEFTALFTTSFMLSNESEATQLKVMLAGAIGEVDPESALRVVLTKLLKLEAQAIRWYRDASKCYLLQLAERLEARFAGHDVLQCCAATSSDCAFVQLLYAEERDLSKALFDMPENHGGVPLAFLKADKDMQFSLDDDGFEVVEVEVSDSD